MTPAPKATTAPALAVESWGLVPYAEAHQRQAEQVAARLSGDLPDTLILTEHPPVYTLGVRAGADRHLLWDAAELAARGIDVVPTRRGGDVTGHNPGQLVGYPIVSLAGTKDLHGYLRLLEAVLIETLAAWGLNAGRREGMTGVWLGNRKIAAIGVAVRRWVTYHGFALNVANDLTHFDGIVPCGITAAEGAVTSLSAELASPVACESVTPVLVAVFRRRWERFCETAAKIRPAADFPGLNGNLPVQR